MHPPLDRPHPDCQDVIAALKACHARGWQKWWGGCNDIKTALDRCLKLEKQRLLQEVNEGLVERKMQEQDLVRQAFGKKETFAEYLARDKEYQRAVQEKKQKEEDNS